MHDHTAQVLGQAFLYAVVAALLVVVTLGTGGSPRLAGAGPDDGCTPSRSTADGGEQQLVGADGTTRSYLLRLPATGEAGRRPLVLDLHGLGSSMQEQERLSRFDGLVDTRGFVLATPQGSVPTELGLTYWNTATGPPSIVDPTLDVDDVAVVAALIDDLVATACVDPARILATGMSNGGYLASRLACDLPERISAIAPVAATLHPEECARTAPVPVLAFHGTDDTIVPFAGGPESVREFHPIDPAVAADAMAEWGEPVLAEAAEWAAHNGCEGPPATGTDRPRERTVRYADRCAAPVEVTAIEGGLHAWPPGATDRILDWFLALPA